MSRRSLGPAACPRYVPIVVVGVASLQHVVEKLCPVEVLRLLLAHGKSQQCWKHWHRYHMWWKIHVQSKSWECRLPTVSSNSGGNGGIGTICGGKVMSSRGPAPAACPWLVPIVLAGVASVRYVVEKSRPVEVLGMPLAHG